MFALEGTSSRELLSLGGRVVVHANRTELEWLFPGQRVVGLRGNSVDEVAHHLGRPAMLLRDHPDMAPVRWPLNPREFL